MELQASNHLWMALNLLPQIWKSFRDLLGIIWFIWTLEKITKEAQQKKSKRKVVFLSKSEDEKEMVTDEKEEIVEGELKTKKFFEFKRVKQISKR